MSKKVILLQYVGRDSKMDAGYVVDETVNIDDLFNEWNEAQREPTSIGNISKEEYTRFLAWLEFRYKPQKIDGLEMYGFGATRYMRLGYE